MVMITNQKQFKYFVKSIGSAGLSVNVGLSKMWIRTINRNMLVDNPMAAK
jgi:hypothetical protein